MRHDPASHRPAGTCPLSWPGLLATALATALVAGCGSGGSSNDEAATPEAPAAPTPPMVRGTVAVGAALAGAELTITDRTGSAACTGTLAPTTAAGTYECSLKDAVQGPLLLVATDPSGAHGPQVAALAVPPLTNGAAVVNLTPLTTAIVGRLAPDGSALTVVATPTLLDAARLSAITQAVVAQLAPVLTALQMPAGYDPFATPLVAATSTQAGNAADRLLDVVRITAVNGVTTLSTVDRPDAPVALADGVTAAPTLAAPVLAALDLTASLQRASNALTQCFALPLAQRVLSTDTTVALADGGPTLLSVAPACEDITADDYRHNGYTAGQAFYALMTSNRMTGAHFLPPEVLQFVDDTSAADRDAAVINLRYVDASGEAGSLFTVARKFPGTATTTRPTDWWLHGNQFPVDVGITASIRLNEQLAPNPGTAPFFNASSTRFESGLNVYVNMRGPGSRGLRAARVKGPGLPNAGLVYTPPMAEICTSQDWLNIQNKDGIVDPAVAVPSYDTGSIFRLQRSLGIEGTAATTARPNPNAGNRNRSNVLWAHPLDYGREPGSTDYVDFAALHAGASYSFELFYDGETDARHTVTRGLLTAVMPATTGGSLRWNRTTDATREMLDPAKPAGGAQASFNVAWTQDPLAERVRSIGVYTWDAERSVNQGTVAVPRGATAVVANAPTGSGCESGETFPALLADGISGRSIQLRHRMLDGSSKDTMTRYN